MGGMQRFKSRFWHVPYTQDEAGCVIYGRPPLLRRLFGPLVEHWMRHWQLWVMVAATLAAGFIARS